VRTIALTSLILLTTGTASAHIAMTKPAPRTEEQKEGPCGTSGSRRGTRVTNFAPGETITIEWDETVDHPGHYRIAFDNDGNDAFIATPNNPNDNFPSTLVEPIVDKVGGHYTQTITLPDEPCTNCTIQLVQVMTTSVPYNSFYFQCADITIGDGGGSNGGSSSGDGDDVSGGCSTGAGAGIGAGMNLIVLALLRRRRARRLS
jgi:hypothetical protein